MDAVLTRFSYGDQQTLGWLQFGVFGCFVLELPDLNNQRNISCVPEGDYECEIYDSPKRGKVFLVKTPGQSHVEGRTWIQIHAGNYNDDTKGCLLVGKGCIDIDKDGLLDVSNSKAALKQLKKHAGNSFNLFIQGC